MINQGTWAGRLTKDPELRYTPAGKAVTRFTIACDRNFTNQAGEREADFIPVEVWGKGAENVAKMIVKGDLVGCTGQVRTSSSTGQDGVRRYFWTIAADNVKFLNVKAFRDGAGAPAASGNTNAPADAAAPNVDAHKGFKNDPFAENGPIDLNDEDLPF